MGFVYTDNLTPGMILESDLRTSSRKLLLPKGATLDEHLITTLKARGVTKVNISGISSDTVNPHSEVRIPPELRAETMQYLAPSFALNSLHHPIIAELFRLAVEHTATRIQLGWQPPAPMDAEKVDSILRQKEEVRRKLPPSVSHFVKEGESLVSLPEVYGKIVQTLNSPTSSAAKVADLVSKDSNLAGRLLKIVNSPFYRLSTPVNSISRAITLIGSNELTTLALGVTVLRAFQDIPSSLIDMGSFWRHSITCGTFARLLATRIGGLPEEHFFVGGLLHDIGRLMLLKTFSEPYVFTMVFAREQQLPLFRAEREILGFDHGRIGALIGEKWHLSKTLRTMIGYHHYPKSGNYDIVPSVLHVANIMAASFSHGLCADIFVPRLDLEAWNVAGVQVEELEDLMTNATKQIDQTFKTFLGKEVEG